MRKTCDFFGKNVNKKKIITPKVLVLAIQLKFDIFPEVYGILLHIKNYENLNIFQNCVDLKRNDPYKYLQKKKKRMYSFFSARFRNFATYFII